MNGISSSLIKTNWQQTINRLLAILAIALSTLALFLGDFEHLDEVVSNNQTSAYDVALIIKQRQPHILVDLRSQQERLEYSLPGAVDLQTATSLINHLLDEKIQLAPNIIIYGHEGNRRWQQLYKQGLRISFLNYGIEQWLGNIMSPVIYRLAPTNELQQFEQRAEISRYFGGLPRYSNEPVEVLRAEQQMDKLKRRGCGF